MNTNMTLSQLIEMENHVPTLAGFASRLCSRSTYEDWITRLYIDIDDYIARSIITSASIRQKDEEDRYNIEIANYLNMIGYDAGHDTFNKGHPDIIVNDKIHGYQWLGESKIHRKYDDLLEGFKQLSDRYSSGNYKQNHGAVIIINKGGDTAKVVNKWKEMLIDDPFYKSRSIKAEICTQNKDCFISTHEHTGSSNDYTVRHIPINVYYKPVDKSAKKSEARNK